MTRRELIRVLIADDNADVRDALASLIESDADLELVAAASDAAQAVEFAAREQPDVALVDVRMPAGGGIAAVRGIAAESPQTRLIALSAGGVPPRLWTPAYWAASSREAQSTISSTPSSEPQRVGPLGRGHLRRGRRRAVARRATPRRHEA